LGTEQRINTTLTKKFGSKELIMVERLLQLPESLMFRPKFLCDPPPWVMEHLEVDILRELVINEVEMHKEILAAQIRVLEAQIKASDRTLEILSQRR